jgi:hypothetical protein
MSTLREAAQQALEALENAEEDGNCEYGATDALRSALAQQEREPVAWMDDFGNAFPLGAVKGAGSWRDDHQRNWTPLYTHPPRREWQSLTEEEIGDVFQAARNAKLGSANDNSRHRLSVVEIARAVEQALKEKNHE